MQSVMKKMILVAATAVIAMAILTACAKTTEQTEDHAAGAEAQDTQAPAQEEGGNGPASRADGGENEPVSGEKDGENGQASEGGEDSAFRYINEGKDLYGDIVEIGENQFSVTEIYMETGDDGAEIMTSIASGMEEEASKITVTYDEDTKFVKQKIWDGGAGHEEKEGTAADLEKGFTAEMNGSYEGDVFHATEILIVEVILE